MARRRETLDIAIAIVKGEAEPAEPYALERDRAVTIGRTGTIRLLDQLVSIHHARVIFDPNKQVYLIEDLGSATGTFVNGECVRGERRELKLGTELRFGETTLRVERVARLTWVFPVVGAASGLLVLGAFVLCLGWILRPTPGKDPLVWEDGVLTSQGRHTTIPVPDTFRWARGLSLPLRLRHVSDYDFSGRDEMWIVDGKGKHEVVVTFDEKGEWVELGMLPSDCVIRGDDTVFPIVDCKGEQWRMDPVEQKYRPVFHEGPVVWYRPIAAKPPTPAPEKKPKKPKKPKKGAPEEPVEEPPILGNLPKDKPLVVGRFALKDKYQLGQFLSERGVYEPVHYIICEGAFEGIRAQVLTYSGLIQELSVGCIEEMRMEGQVSGRPYAAAFTPAGLRALTGDVMTFYAGDPEGLFLESKWAPVRDVLFADPGHYRGSVKLFAGTKNASIQIFDPIPPLESVVEGTHRLVEMDRMLTPARPAHTVTIPGPGVHDFRTEGCETFRVDVGSYDSPGWFSSSTLLTVTEVGCGKPRKVLSAGYVQKKTVGKVGELEVVVDVELENVLIGGVVRVRLSWR